MKKKILIPILFTTLTIALRIMDPKEAPAPEVSEAPKAKPFAAQDVDASRIPAAAPTKKKTLPARNFSKSIQLEKQIQEDEWIEQTGLPADLKLSKDLFAIDEKSYTPSMGEILSNAAKTITFRSDSRPNGAQYMAVDPENHKVYPIAPTVRVANVNAETRNKIIGEGYIEHYYNEDLDVMFVEGQDGDVLSALSELTGLNLEASLEVIRGFHGLR